MKLYMVCMIAVGGFLLISAQVNAQQNVSERGYWLGKDVVCEHFFDPILAEGLATYFKRNGAANVVDFGCGLCDYVRYMMKCGISCEGYDGNPETPALTEGLAHVIDLSVPFNLGKKYDWVLSLEVGEHLPAQYEKIFIENLIRHCATGIVLSWAVKGQGGYGHFNEQDNAYIKKILTDYGFTNDLASEHELRNAASAGHFKNTIMVFRKNQHVLIDKPQLNKSETLADKKPIKKKTASATLQNIITSVVSDVIKNGKWQKNPEQFTEMLLLAISSVEELAAVPKAAKLRGRKGSKASTGTKKTVPKTKLDKLLESYLLACTIA